MLSNGTLFQYLHRCPKERFLNMSHRILATNTHAITNLSTKLKQINQSFLSFYPFNPKIKGITVTFKIIILKSVLSMTVS